MQLYTRQRARLIGASCDNLPMRALLLCALPLMGCQPRPTRPAPGPASTATPTPAPTTSASLDAAVAVAVAAPAPDAALPARTLPWVGLPRRGGERLLLEEGTTVTARDGTTVLLAIRNHKHAVHGSTLGIYGFGARPRSGQAGV